MLTGIYADRRQLPWLIAAATILLLAGIGVLVA